MGEREGGGAGQGRLLVFHVWLLLLLRDDEVEDDDDDDDDDEARYTWQGIKAGAPRGLCFFASPALRKPPFLCGCVPDSLIR